MSKRRVFYFLLAILLLIVAVAGWFITDYISNDARQETISASEASVSNMVVSVYPVFAHVEGIVQFMADSPWFATALLSKRDQNIAHANNELDRYNSTSNANASVSYLIDADGLTVASSNRKDPDSFVGKSYRFRSYFQEAAKGQPGRYLGLDITSGKKVFYASYPVQNRLGKVLGVVMMKRDLAKAETLISKYPFCFLISPDGIIFLSSKPAMVFKSLWPLDKSVREKLIASRQFGNKLSDDSFFKKEIADGTEVTLEGKDYFVSRKVIDSDGWSIVLLTPTNHITINEVIGILATIFVCFLIIAFSGIIYLTDQSRETIRQSEESKHLILHTALEGIFGGDATGQVTFANPASLRMLGFAEEEMLGQSAHALIHHSHKDGSNYPVEDCPMYASYTRGTENHVTDEVLWRKDGSSFPVEYSSAPITKDGKILGVVVTFKDITQHKQWEEEIRQSEERYRTIIEQMEDGYFETDLTGKFTFVNDAECNNLEYTREEMIGMDHRTYADEKNAKALYRLFVEVYKTGVPVKAYDFDLTKKDGTKSYDEISVSLIRDAEGKPIGFRGIARNITERKQLMQKIEKMATHDSLTGLPNRVLLADRFAIAEALARRNKFRLAVLSLDLDKFKSINDTLGHNAGDQVLKVFSTRLTGIIRASDTVARMGGDEFILVLLETKQKEDTIVIAQKILNAFIEPLSIDGHQLRLSTSIGIAIYPEDAEDMETLIKKSDAAMYYSKGHGRNQFKFFGDGDVQISGDYKSATLI